MRYKLGISFIIICLTFLYACKKKDVTPMNTDSSIVVPTGDLKFHLHTYIGEQEVDAYNIDYPMPNGHMISLNMAELYLSEIQLVRVDGSLYNVSTNGVLKVFESEGVEIGKVPVGNYKSVRFKVGLTPDVNTLEPTTTGYVNLLNQAEMWFSTKAQPDGYVYMNFSGSIDTTAAQTGVKIPLEYKIGTETKRVQIEMPTQNFSISKDAVGYVHMKIQYDRLFDGINLSYNANLHVITKTDNALPIVETLKKNMQKLFIYEN